MSVQEVVGIIGHDAVMEVHATDCQLVLDTPHGTWVPLPYIAQSWRVHGCVTDLERLRS